MSRLTPEREAEIRELAKTHPDNGNITSWSVLSLEEIDALRFERDELRKLLRKSTEKSKSKEEKRKVKRDTVCNIGRDPVVITINRQSSLTFMEFWTEEDFEYAQNLGKTTYVIMPGDKIDLKIIGLSRKPKIFGKKGKSNE